MRRTGNLAQSQATPKGGQLPLEKTLAMQVHSPAKYPLLIPRSFDSSCYKNQQNQLSYWLQTQLGMEEGLSSTMVVPWSRQESLPLAPSAKPYTNSSHNPTLFTTTAEKRKMTLSGLLRGHWGIAETPTPANAETPMEGARMGNTSQEPYSIRCSPALGFNRSHMKPRWFPE